MALDLASLLTAPLPPGTKGLPAVPRGFSTADVARQGWNILAGDLPMPVAVLKASALSNNIAAMQAYLSASAMQLAPHGKTSLCPQLFERQLDAGAWGITVATISQLRLCHEIGVPRVLMANELVGGAEIALFSRLCADAPDREYYVLVDSISGAEQIQAGFAGMQRAPPARVLVEVGFAGGRCGVRNIEEGLVLARAVARMDRLLLCGIEGYEGLITGPDPRVNAQAVDAYLAVVTGLFRAVRNEGLFADPGQILLSAGGSAYYDLVMQLFAGEADPAVIPVVRSGCYLTQDFGFYHRLLAEIDARAVLGPAPALRPALEIWARVLSHPEPGRAILSAGKRDLSFDIDLPVPQAWFRAGRHSMPQPIQGWHIAQLSDQHGFALAHGEDATALAVGDLVALGISHPCTTFDKWSLLFEVDDDYAVIGGLKTCF